MTRVWWAGPLLAVALAMTFLGVRCTSQPECATHSDCLPGRFCSADNFCEFQCRTAQDCGKCHVCDLRFGLCIQTAPASFDGLGTCCPDVTDKAEPMSPDGICLAPDAGTPIDGDADGGNTSDGPAQGDAAPTNADAASDGTLD